MKSPNLSPRHYLLPQGWERMLTVQFYKYFPFFPLCIKIFGSSASHISTSTNLNKERSINWPKHPRPIHPHPQRWCFLSLNFAFLALNGAAKYLGLPKVRAISLYFSHRKWCKIWSEDDRHLKTQTPFKQRVATGLFWLPTALFLFSLTCLHTISREYGTEFYLHSQVDKYHAFSWHRVWPE